MYEEANNRGGLRKDWHRGRQTYYINIPSRKRIKAGEACLQKLSTKLRIFSLPDILQKYKKYNDRPCYLEYP